MDGDKETYLLDLLRNNSARIQKLADIEAKRALNGVSGHDTWPEKKKLIIQCEKILDELEQLYSD